MIETYLKQTKFSNKSREIEECRGELAGGVGECHKVISLPSANRRWFHRVCTKPPEVCWARDWPQLSLAPSLPGHSLISVAVSSDLTAYLLMKM